MKVAVVDLGSTTFSMLVAKLGKHGRLRPVARAREPVSLGAHALTHGGIEPSGWRSVLVALAGLVGAARLKGARRIVAVATGAIRESPDGEDRMATIERELGLSARILRPDRAAALTYLGVRHRCEETPERLAVVDIGGGSIEIAMGNLETPRLTWSSPLGIARLQHMARDLSMRETLARLERELSVVAGEVRAYEPNRVIFASGTARAVHRFLHHGEGAGRPSPRMDPMRWEAAVRRARGATPAELIGMGVRRHRVSTMAMSTSVVGLVAQRLGASRFEVSRAGLRDGVAITAARGLPPLGGDDGKRALSSHSGVDCQVFG